MQMPPVYIIGIGGKIGSTEITAQELGTRFSLSADEITQKTGITKLYRFGSDQTLVDVSRRVAQGVMLKWQLGKENINGVFASSNCTTETILPGYATQVAAALGLTQVLADQVGMGCGGSLQALRTAYDRLVVETIEGKTGYYLVIAGDATSLILDERDYATGFIFSEGVSVLLVTNDRHSADDGYEISAIGTKSFLGEELGLLKIANPYWPSTRGELSGFKMAGGGVFRFGASLIPHFLELVGAREFGNDWILFPHQANLRMLKQMALNARIPEERVYMDGIKRIGNTSPPAVFLGLEDGLRRQTFDRSNTVLLGAFGAELTVGAALLQPRGDPARILC